jgi:pyruvate dehydrogenase E2 component (dihydrolipoamide acetyltransferase)
MAHPVLVPPLGQTVDTVTIVTWYKREGEAVREGEPLYAIETDKAVLDIEAQASGVLRGVTATEGDEVEVLRAIAEIATAAEGGTVGTTAEAADGAPEVAPSESSVAARAVTPVRRGPRQFVSPRARRLAEAEGVSLEEVAGSGPEGAVVERDVRAWLERRSSAQETPPRELAAPAAAVSEVVVAQMGAKLAGAPLVTLDVEADASALTGLRAQLAAAEVEIADTDLWLCVLGRALRDQPALNASLEGDVLRRWPRVQVGLVVDTGDGLAVPVVRDVDQKRLAQLARETRELRARAHEGALTAEDLKGATFTLADLGAAGIDTFTPFLDAPTTAMMGVGRIRKGGGAADATVWLSLSYDRRLVDAGRASRFLRQVAQLIEQPYRLLA